MQEEEVGEWKKMAGLAALSLLSSSPVTETVNELHRFIIKGYSAYVSIFIALTSDDTDVHALFQLTLLDQTGKSKHKVHSHFDCSLESSPYTLKYRGTKWLIP